MKCLYLNSELFVASEGLSFFSQTAWRGLVFMEGPRILLGEDPILVRSHVSDLRTDEEHEALNKLELLLLGFRDEERGQS